MTQKTRESLQDFATVTEQLAHRACPTLPENHMWRVLGKAFAYGVEEPNIIIQLLFKEEKR
jgi:hypothetical protein